MTITLNGSTGITNDGGYTGDGVVFADGTPENTLVTTTAGNVGIGVTPSAWATLKSLDIASGASFASHGASGVPVAYVTANTYYDGSNWIYKGSDAVARYDVNANSTPSHVWWIAPSGTAGNTVTFTQAMTLDAGGNLLVGTTVTDPRNLTSGSGCAIRANTNAAFEYASSDASSAFINNTNSASGAATFIGFRQRGQTRGSITTNGSTTAYNTTSDYRLKENIAPMTSALAVIGQLKPCTYTWKSTGEASQGFIAHELQEVVPDCVTGEKDAVDEEGNPQYQGIDTSFLVATLTAAIQEMKQIIDAQAERITALEQA